MTSILEKEIVRPAFENRELPVISYGLGYDEALQIHINGTTKSERVYVIVSRSLEREMKVLDRLRTGLGDKIVGHRIGLKPHTFFSELLEVIHDAKPQNPDCIVTIGGGSLTDAAKIISFALANDVETFEDLTTLATRSSQNPETLQAAVVKHIAVPTTLSAGEYSSYAGGTNDLTKNKMMFCPPTQNPCFVILDPQLTTTTPERPWLSSGVRALDHCVEGLCSIRGTPEADAAAAKALKLLVPSLMKCKANPRDLGARLNAQLGSIESMNMSRLRVPMGASHAIGHQLGPLGVGHGETSCICLPAVCKYNMQKKVNVDRQEKAAGIFLEFAEVQTLISGTEEVDLASIMDKVIRFLGLPRSLAEVNIGADAVDQLAENTLKDPWVLTNPYPLTEKADVLELLETIVR